MVERWLNYFRNMLRARCEHERHLCHRRKALRGGVEQNSSDLFSRRSSSRLARFNILVAGRAQSRGQLAQLRALAGSIKSFESDKFSAARHRGMIAAQVRP